jgi:hypothetical protein
MRSRFWRVKTRILGTAIIAIGNGSSAVSAQGIDRVTIWQASALADVRPAVTLGERRRWVLGGEPESGADARKWDAIALYTIGLKFPIAELVAKPQVIAEGGLLHRVGSNGYIGPVFFVAAETPGAGSAVRFETANMFGGQLGWYWRFHRKRSGVAVQIDIGKELLHEMVHHHRGNTT